MTVQKVCSNCGKDFNCKPSQVSRSTYCSKACMSNDYKTRLKGELNPHYKGIDRKTCNQCGKEYASYSKNSKFCSRRCLGLSRSEHLKTISHLGAATKKKNTQRWHCQVCGIQVDYRRKYCDECLPTNRYLTRKKDLNQDEIVAALIEVGATIIDLHGIGWGVPDIFIGVNGVNIFMEIKNPKTRGKLSKRQQEWHSNWRGPIHIVYGVADAIDVVNRMTASDDGLPF